MRFGFGYKRDTDVPFQVIAVDTVQGKLLRINVKVNPGDDGAEVLLIGENPESFTLKPAESAVHVNADATRGDECNVYSRYRGLESDPDRFIVTAN